MGEFQGTKGEWRVDVHVGHQNIETRNIVQINGGITVAQINRFSPYEIPMEIQEANAKLIAAAPELLEVLQSIVEYWDNLQKGSLNDHIEHSLKIAELAIKKATE